MEGNQENQIIPGKTFAFRPAKSEQIPGILSALADCYCYIKMRAEADGGKLCWMLEVAGEHVVLCYHTKTEQPSRLERMKTLTSASVDKRVWSSH